MSDRSYNLKMHFSASRQILREGIFCSSFISTLGALTAAWLLLLLEAVTFPLRRIAARPIPGASLMAEVL